MASGSRRITPRFTQIFGKEEGTMNNSKKVYASDFRDLHWNCAWRTDNPAFYRDGPYRPRAESGR
jgi:hypothetical protein